MRIILVEDNPDDSFLFQEMIRDAFPMDCDIEVYTRLDDALEPLSTADVEVALVDVGLPDAQGQDTIAKVFSVPVRPPVLFLTGNADEQLAMAAVGKGAQDYLYKGDMTPALLSRSIRYAIERQQMERRILHMEKMEAVGQLAGGVAHDFNNQLAAIMSCADMLHDSVSEPNQRRYVDNILTAAQRSADLVRQLLTFSRKSQWKVIPVDMHEIIEEATTILCHTIDPRIQIQQDLDSENTQVLGDPSHLQNAILNLGLNARDAMPEGGFLHIQTSTQDLEAADCDASPFSIKPGSFFKLAIRDSGCGMSDEIRRNIFDPFFTTKEVGKGTGMGLAAVYGAIEQHNGSITVESAPGKGSTFTILLPLDYGAISQSSESKLSPEAIAGTRILVIDDEAILRDMIVETLEEFDCPAHGEGDGQSGIQYYREHWQETDLVILDMIMPKTSGVETFVSLKSINPDVRVILSSGFSESEDIYTLQSKGVTALLPKPFHTNDLLTAIQTALS